MCSGRGYRFSIGCRILIFLLFRPSCQDYFSAQKLNSAGVPIFFGIGIRIFCYWGAHAQFRNPTITPSGRKVTGREEKKMTSFELTDVADKHFINKLHHVQVKRITVFTQNCHQNLFIMKTFIRVK